MTDLPDMPEPHELGRLHALATDLDRAAGTALADAFRSVLARAEACYNGDCECSREVVEALMQVGGWEEIDGDGSPASVLADHIRRLDYRIEP